MTRDKLKELQHDAALNLIAAVKVQMEYRRSTPLSVERMLGRRLPLQTLSCQL